MIRSNYAESVARATSRGGKRLMARETPPPPPPSPRALVSINYPLCALHRRFISRFMLTQVYVISAW